MDILINIPKNYSQFDLSMANFSTGSTFSLLEKEAPKKNLNYFEDEKFIGLSRLNNLRSKIEGFTHLEANWDSYNADVIDKNVINKALDTLDYLHTIGLLSNGIVVHVFPMRDGGIQFDFDGKNVFAELEISPNKDFTFILFNEKGKVLSKEQLFELSQLSTIIEEVEYA